MSSTKISTFLNDAPKDEYLVDKVILIFGFTEACRKAEICALNIIDVQDSGTSLTIQINATKTHNIIRFDIDGEFYTIVKKYIILRPTLIKTTRFFVNVENRSVLSSP